MKTAFVLLLMLTAIFLPGCQKDMDTQPEEELRLDTFDPNAFDFTEWRDCFDEVATAIDSATFAQKWGTPVGRNIWYRSGTKDFLVIPLLKNNLVQNLFVVDSQGQSFTVKKTNILYYEDLEGTGLSKHLLRLFDLEKTELYPTLNLTSIRNKVDDVFTAVNSSGLLKLTEKTPYNLATDSSIRHNSSGLRGIYIEDNCLDYWETYMLDYIVQYINDLAGEQVFVLGEFDGQWYCAFDGNTPFPVDLFLQAGVNCCFQGYCVCPNPQSLFESLVPLMNNYPNTQIRLAMAYFAEVGMEFSVPEQLCLYNNISLTRNVFSLLTNGFNGEINIEDPNLIDIGYTYVEAFCDNSLDNADSFFTYLQNKFSNNPYSQQNECEKNLTWEHPFCAISIALNWYIANTQTITFMGFNGEDDCSDAFRHCYFNAINSCSCGVDVAEEFGIAHECGSTSSIATEMDLHNNGVGYKIYNEYSICLNIDYLAEKVCEKLESGELYIIEFGSTVYSVSCSCLN